MLKRINKYITPVEDDEEEEEEQQQAQSEEVAESVENKKEEMPFLNIKRQREEEVEEIK
jgi:hypothetical protein